MKKIFFSVIILILFQVFLHAQKKALASIRKDDLEAYMTFFASDEMQGRETGTNANDAAALFIKSNLMRMGLKSIPATGSYFQKIPLVQTEMIPRYNRISAYGIDGKLLSETDSILPLMTSGASEISGRLVFAGYGYNDGAGYDDLSGVEVENKVVLIMTRNPEMARSGEGNTMLSDLEIRKAENIFKKGAKAILFVYDPLCKFSDVYQSGLKEMIPFRSLAKKTEVKPSSDVNVLFITRKMADNILGRTNHDLRELQGKINYSGRPSSFEVEGINISIKIPVNKKEINASNVIGIIEGSDPVLKNECVIYTAHYDHVGMNENNEIYNGADDNASGSMALLEVAGAFMNLKKKPLRTIIFAWVNGEEKGLIGSEYYVNNPVLPLEKTLLDINLDMIGRSRMVSDTGKIYGFDPDVTSEDQIIVYTAHESSELLKMVYSSAGKAGLEVSDRGKDHPFGSSDHASFRANKVPALFFHSGVHTDLHSPGDDVEKIDFDKMEKVSKMVFLLGYEVADKRERIKVDK